MASISSFFEEENKEREIEVTVSITLSKSLKIKVSDYNLKSFGKDEDGDYFEDIDYSECDLKRAVEDQINLPQYSYKHCLKDTKAYKDLKHWIVDDFEVIMD